MATKSSSRRSRRTEKPIVSSQDWDRRHLPGMQLHESEKLLVGLLTLLVLFLPWALGSTHLLAQAIAGLLAAATLGAALLPRHGDTHSITTIGQFKRLFGFPVFWLGSLLLVYLAIQGFNPSAVVEGTEGFRYLTDREHISWLPAGISASLTESNPFRWLLIVITPFFAVCAAWIGLTRRRSIHLLLGAIAINGFFVAAIGFYQVAKNKKEILWFYEPPTQTFLGSFPYHWQGAAYLTVVLAATVGLAAHHYARARKTFRRSNPSGLFLFIGLVLTLMIIFSYSRAAAGLAGGIMVAFLAHIGYRELAPEAPLSRKVLLNGVGVVLVAIGILISGSVAGDYLERKTSRGINQVAIAPSGSWVATTSIAATMFRERPLYGWGGGSFPHVYQQIAEREGLETAPPSLAVEYAVSDWFRFPAELGAAGSLLLLLIFGFLFKQFFHIRTFQNPLAGFLLLGVIAGMVLSLASLTFQSVAFFTTWSLLLAFGGILIRVESTARSRAEVESA